MASQPTLLTYKPVRIKGLKAGIKGKPKVLHMIIRPDISGGFRLEGEPG